jgi:hypothetical protein
VAGLLRPRHFVMIELISHRALARDIHGNSSSSLRPERRFKMRGCGTSSIGRKRDSRQNPPVPGSRLPRSTVSSTPSIQSRKAGVTLVRNIATPRNCRLGLERRSAGEQNADFIEHKPKQIQLDRTTMEEPSRALLAYRKQRSVAIITCFVPQVPVGRVYWSGPPWKGSMRRDIHARPLKLIPW